jgi:Tfp pilus assembly protein PilF
MVVEGFGAQLRKFVRREISSREGALQERISSDPQDAGSRNRLGVLYARYGLIDEAQEVFTAAANLGYAPAITNLANLAFLRGDLDAAEDEYRRALELSRESPVALLGLARVSYQQENYGLVREMYSRLAQIAPEMASRYEYLSPRADAGARAAGAAVLATTVEWEEEP